MSRTPWPRGRSFLRSYWTPAGKQALGNLVGLVACTGVPPACVATAKLLEFFRYGSWSWPDTRRSKLLKHGPQCPNLQAAEGARSEFRRRLGATPAR